MPEQRACCCVPALPCSSSSGPSLHESPPLSVLSALPPPAAMKQVTKITRVWCTPSVQWGGGRKTSLPCKHSLPANGSSFQPLVRMGVEGVTCCTGCFHSSCIIRILPHVVLATKTSPRRKVPCWMRTVATGLRNQHSNVTKAMHNGLGYVYTQRKVHTYPKPLSTLDSMMTPSTGPWGSAVQSHNSACARTASTRASSPVP